jgi:ankyrin repeat protein
MGDETTEEAAGGLWDQVKTRGAFPREPLERSILTFLDSLEHRQRVAAKVQAEIVAKDYQSGDIVKYYGWKKIAQAGRLGDLPKLSTLLNEPVEKINSTDDEGNTALHHAVLSACQYNYAFDHFYQCIDLLLRNMQVEVNMPNTKGYTAIGLAVHHLHKTCIEHMLKHQSSHRLYLDYYPGDSEYTVREIIMQTYPDLQPLVPAPQMESLDSTEIDTKLLAALQHDKYSIFRDNLDSLNPNPWYDEPYHSSLLEIACQMKNRKRFVKLLLDSGADPNIKNRITDMPLLHATARSGNFDMLELLLKEDKTDVCVKDIEDRTILHWWARVSEKEPDDKLILEYCFNFLLEKYSVTKMSVDCRDISDNTALYTAVESGFRDRAVLLLNKGADITVFEQVNPILSKANKSLLEGILDDCLEIHNEPVMGKECKLTYKYQLLEKMLPPMAEGPQLRQLLRHPVVETFLSLKWQKIKLFYFFDLAFYVIFLLILTAYIMLSETNSTPSNGYFANNTNVPFSFNDSNTVSTIHVPIYRRVVKYTMGDSSPLWLWVCLLISLAGLTTREIFQLFLYGRTYIWSLENGLQIVLITATLVSCSRLVENMEIRLHFSVVAIVLAWVELVLMSGRMPLLSLQMEMLKRVSLTFLWYMTSYVLLMVAFALVFYMLFKGSVDADGTDFFANPLLSLLKTIIMLTGEFDASSLPFDNMPYTSHVIFLLFVVLVTIILLNLLNGLAVSDTDAIQKNAETLSLVARVRLISRIERLAKFPLTSATRSKLLTEPMCILYPNRPNSIGTTQFRSLLKIINKKRQPNKKRESSFGEDNWSVFTEKLCALQLRQDKVERKLDEMQQILMQILTHLDVQEYESTRL